MLVLFADSSYRFEQQTSKSARLFIPCSISSSCSTIYSVDFGKYIVMFSSFIHAFYIKVYNRDLKSTIQKNFDKAYPFTLFSGNYAYDL